MYISPFKVFHVRGVFKNFVYQGWGTKFRYFFKRSFFSAELIFSNLRKKNDSRGFRGHAPPNNF